MRFVASFYFNASILRQTGDGIPGVSDTNVSFPVFGFTRNVTMLLEAWCATHKNSPFPSMRKLRGVFPLVAWCPMGVIVPALSVLYVAGALGPLLDMERKRAL